MLGAGPAPQALAAAAPVLSPIAAAAPGPSWPRPAAEPPQRAMAGRLLRGCERAAAAGWAAVARGLPAAPGLCPCRGCGEAAGLRAMGFSEEQARRLLGQQPRLGPQRRQAAAAQLLLLGLSAESALGLLERSPALLQMPTERLQQRASELRRLGLSGGRAARRRGGGARGARLLPACSPRHAQASCCGRSAAAPSSSPCPGGEWQRRCGCCGRNASSPRSSCGRCW